MICLIEPQCVEWQHEMVNAGFMKLVRQSFPSDKIELVAEKKHASIISKLAESSIAIKKEITPPILNDYTNKKTVEYYIDLVNQIIKENGAVDRIVFLSSHQNSIEAVSQLAKSFSEVRFILVVHAILEWAYDYRIIPDFRSYKYGKRSSQLRKAFSKASKLNNVCFITYSPYIDEIRRLYPREISEKFEFLHHPYPYEVSTEKMHIHEDIVVGILGACMNEYAENIIRQTQSISCVRMLPFNKDTRISREDISNRMGDVDCLLMPYDERKYRISASGVLFDALNYNKPIVGMKSPILQYYNNRFDVGWMMDGTDDIVELLESGSINKEKLNDKKGNIAKCKMIIDVENIERCKKILSN